MKTQARRFAAIAAGVAALLGTLQGCGTSSVSRGISDEGRVAEAVFPDILDEAWQKAGSFPNLDNLRAVAPGLTKDQLYDLLGRPHFNEGIGGVREWDYIFNFRSGGGVTTCRYKAIFDTDYRVRTLIWRPDVCTGLLTGILAPASRPLPTRSQRIALLADALFVADRSSISDILPDAQRQLAVLATELKRDYASFDSITITGHSDRLGDAGYNQAFSLARADALRELLAQHGLEAGLIRTIGKGGSEPVANCAAAAGAALVGCLAPDRRMVIEVSGRP